MDSRYYRPSSPRSRLVHPGRSSTGTFADPYYDSSYYPRGGATSPRTSGERIAGSHHQPVYASSSSSGSRSTKPPGYDSYSGRPRRNTLTESNDHLARPNLPALIPPVASIPIRAPGVHAQHDHPSSPLSRSWDTRGDTYITPGPSRREHKRIYSVDDNSHSAKLVAEQEVIEPRRRESGDSRGYSVTSGGRSYHQSKPLIRAADLGDEGYSYTDAAGMYRDTEPAWRRPRSGSVERGSRPTSMLMERGPRTSNRELGPPPSTRGFDRINNGAGRIGSVRDHHARSSSIERSRDAPKCDPYPDTAVARSSSTRHHAPTVHQEPREHRRDTYHEEYDRRDRDRDLENKRHGTTERFEDRDVTTRGFGIAPGNPSLAHDHQVLDRQPIWDVPEVGRARPEEYGAQYYAPERAEVRMPDPRIPDARIPRERDVAPNYDERPRERDAVPAYDERPRERDRERRRDTEDRGHVAPVVPVAAGAAAATYGAAEILKSRDRDRERDRDSERERERRKERDERDRRDRLPDDRRDRMAEERRDRAPEDRRDRAADERRDRMPEERIPPASLPPATAAFALDEDVNRKGRERRYEEDGRDRRHRKAPSSDDSNDERPRHYVDRDVARESDRRKDSGSKEAALDPDEEYRRRVQQEAERVSRASRDRDRDHNDSDRDRERRRRNEDRDGSHGGSDNVRSRGPPSNMAEPAHSRYNERSGSLLDSNIVQEPDSLTSPAIDREPSKTVQIVAPPKEPQPAPKGILRKPTEKFPEHPDNIREGVAPHKSQLKGKDIPVDARWTKIDRRLVNPEALEEAKERFEERMDCVIVLRVLTKQEIQKLADRTKEIREAKYDDYEHRDRKDRDRRSHHSHRDGEDRDRRREHDDSDDDYTGRDRHRERDRDREPRMIEAGR